MSAREYRFGTIGLGSYGEVYLSAIQYLSEQGLGRLAAAVVRSPEKYRERMTALEKTGTQFYPDLASMLRSEKLDIVGVPTDMSSHVPYSIEAMEAGCDVICEKPLCATVQEAAELIAARDRIGRRVAVGYQTMHNPSTHELKRRLVDGSLGKLKRIRCKTCMPRPDYYYARNAWSGRLKTADGRWLLDSPANNANAHQLQEILYLAGPAFSESARLARVYAELYRGRPDIENFDTCSMRMTTLDGAELLFISSHCVSQSLSTIVEVECERGVITRGGPPTKRGDFIHRADGREEEVKIDPGVPNLAFRAFTNMIGAIEEREPLFSTPDNTRQQTLVIDAAHDSSGGPVGIDISHTGTGNVLFLKKMSPGRFILGIEDLMARCYDERKTFSEIGAPWTKPAKWIDVSHYEYFPGGRK